MILDLKSIFVNEGSCLTVNFNLDLSDMVFSGVHAIQKPVKVEGFVSNRAGIVSVNVVCLVVFDAPCDRCGKQTAVEHNVHIDRVLVTKLESEPDDEIIEIPDMRLDMDELCTTEVVLAIPMKHLCKPDCKGICPTCGKDLNKGSCDCVQNTVDPRLEALRQLLD